jgi:O-antigen ligase
MLAFALAAAFLLGGGSRADITSLIILRPLSVMLLGYALWDLKWQHVKDFRFLFAMATAILALVVIQLLPLPPSIWSHLPGRELVVAIDRAADLGAVWRPISMVPGGTLNAFFALFLPFAVLLLGAGLNREERSSLLYVLLGLGGLSAVLAVLQLGSAPDGPLYFYETTNNGAAVGLFANRNHEAVLLASLFPLLAAFASPSFASALDARLRLILAAAIGLALVALLLVAGSRAGLITGGIALLAVPLIYRGAPAAIARTSARSRIWAALIAALVVAGLVLLTIARGRAEAVERMHGFFGDEIRYRAWRPVMDMVWKYFPTGSGYGSFRDIFRIGEPRDLLAATEFYHAHNDWLEIVLTGGLPALLLLLIACLTFASKVIRLIQAKDNAHEAYLLAWAGSLILFLLGIASIVDYPLRVPSIECLFVVAGLWLCSFRTEDGKPKSIDRQA